GQRRGGERDARAPRRVARARSRARRLGSKRLARRIEMEPRPLRLRQRPGVALRHALDAVAGRADLDLDARLLLETVVDALAPAIEEAALQRHVLRLQEGVEIRARLHLEPFLPRAQSHPAADGAA